MPNTQIAVTQTNAAAALMAAGSASGGATAGAGAPARHSGFTFHDFLNIINPLQHIPIVGTLYREITGDVMKPISSILGGVLFGGVIGLAASAVDAIIQETTGEDVGAHILATLGLHHDANETKMAAIPTTPSAPVAKPVPALLVAEAEADRVARARGASAVAAISTTAPTPASAAGGIGTLQPTGFWQSLQRGGMGVNHAAPQAPSSIAINPSKALIDAASVTRPQPPAASPPAPQAVPAAAPAPSAPTPAPAPQAPPQPVAAAAPDAAQPLSRAAIPQMMMQALAKYEAMHRAPQAQAVDQVH